MWDEFHSDFVNSPAKPYFGDSDLEWDSTSCDMTEESESTCTVGNSPTVLSEEFIQQGEMKGEITDSEGRTDDQSVTIDNIFEVIFCKFHSDV